MEYGFMGAQNTTIKNLSPTYYQGRPIKAKISLASIHCLQT